MKKHILITLVFACFFNNEASPLRRGGNVLARQLRLAGRTRLPKTVAEDFKTCANSLETSRELWNKLSLTRFLEMPKEQPGWNTLVIKRYENGDAMILERTDWFFSSRKNEGVLFIQKANGKTVMQQDVKGPISKMGYALIAGVLMVVCKTLKIDETLCELQGKKREMKRDAQRKFENDIVPLMLTEEGKEARDKRIKKESRARYF